MFRVQPPLSSLSATSPASPVFVRPHFGQTIKVVALAALLVGMSFSFGSTTPSAEAMRRVRSPYPKAGTAPAMEAAIRAAFPARLQKAALNVAWCESSGKANARNGQYKGHFQMGSREWAKFGGGGNPYNGHHNARAAYRYYKVAGWSPWECRP